MEVFPETTPFLDIVNVAGVPIPEGTTEAVEILLPFDGSPFQTVTVRATDFVGLVPIQVVLTPNSSDRIIYESQIDMSRGNPSEAIVDILVPLNDPTRIHAWTFTPAPP